jgi:hypothetical protein
MKGTEVNELYRILMTFSQLDSDHKEMLDNFWDLLMKRQKKKADKSKSELIS